MTLSEFNLEYDRLASVLPRFAVSLTRDQDTAKDLMQETAYRAFWNRNKFVSGTNFKAWIMTIMRNTYISAYRKRRRLGQRFTSYEHNLSTSKAASVDNTAHTTFNHSAIVEMLDELNDLYAEPFRMFYTGYSYDEIAEHLQVPMGTVKSRIFCARQKLRERITAAGLQ